MIKKWDEFVDRGDKKCCVCHQEKEDLKPYLLDHICEDCEDRINQAYDEFYD